MRIVLATSNPHKHEEIQTIFNACEQAGSKQRGDPDRPIETDTSPSPHIHLIPLTDLSPVPEPIEDQPTFEGNAILKARCYASATGEICLADDSGLEVDALDGEPGVRSARYTPIIGPRDIVDSANNKQLLRKLHEVPLEKRTACFVCAMALCQPYGQEQPLALVHGSIEGRILTTEEAGPSARGRGEHGFGYDPLFFIPDLGRTTAELLPDQKNQISHRGCAARKMWQAIFNLRSSSDTYQYIKPVT